MCSAHSAPANSIRNGLCLATSLSPLSEGRPGGLVPHSIDRLVLTYRTRYGLFGFEAFEVSCHRRIRLGHHLVASSDALKTSQKLPTHGSLHITPPARAATKWRRSRNAVDVAMTGLVTCSLVSEPMIQVASHSYDSSDHQAGLEP